MICVNTIKMLGVKRMHYNSFDVWMQNMEINNVAWKQDEKHTEINRNIYVKRTKQDNK